VWITGLLIRSLLSNRYPIPRINKLLDKMQGSKVFTSLDLCSAYQQVKLYGADYHKTAFRTPFGLYKYKVLPFGLPNAPSAFMSIINEVIADHTTVKVLWAVIHALEIWRCSLKGSTFKMITCHNPLCQLAAKLFVV
jgi:hypothetical protein